MAPPDLTPSAASSSPGGAPAGYGRSCTNCSRAKCKCILRPSGVDCERCHRLGKECNPITATRRRVEKRHISSRTAQLEEKLDDLVSILRSTQASGSGSGSGSGPGPDSVTLRNPYTQSAAQPGPQDHDSPTSRLDHLATAATASNPQATESFNNKLNANYHQSDDQSEPTPAEAELYLQKFRGWMRNFPFMYLAPEMTAAKLHQDQPFLWLCIMNITSMSIPQMNTLKERVRREVADRMIIRHEPSMEVVLGLLTLLSWATMNFGHGSKPFLVLYSQMAVSVVYELNLTRSPEEDHYFTTSFRPWGRWQPPPKPRSMEERRAVLSLWFLTSEISTFIGKSECLRWTPHMQDSLEVLEREREYEQDATLTSLIRLQLIGDEAHKLLTQDALRGDAGGQTPSYVFRKGLLERLRTARESIPSSAASIHVVQQHGYATEILINSLGQFKTSIPEAQRVDALYSCLIAVRAWFDLFFSVPLGDVPGDPFSIFVQLAQAQVALYRLTTTEDPAWDKELLRNTADLLSILDRSIERFENMLTVYPMKAGNEETSCTLYMKAIKATKNVKAWWEPALSQSLNGMPTPNSQGMNAPSVHRSGPGSTTNSGGGMNMGDRQSMAQGMTPSANQMFVEPMNMDFPDLAWMSDVFMPWEG